MSGASDPLYAALLAAQGELGHGYVLVEGRSVVDANPAYLRLTGYTLPELQAMSSLLEILDPVERERVKKEYLARGLHVPVAEHYETVLVRKDGARVNVELASVPVGDPGRHRVLTLVRDVSEEKSQARQSGVTKKLVRKLLRDLTGGGSATTTARRSLGRSLAAEAQATDLGGYLGTFRSMGLGEVALTHAPDAGRYEFSGRDLLERTDGFSSPTCHIALGFLESAIGALEGRPALGAETACQSRGADVCTFIVHVKGR